VSGAGTRRARLAALAAGVTTLAFSSWTAADAARLEVDPGRLPQTTALPSTSTPWFRARMTALWRGISEDSLRPALPSFFPRAAYIQVKQIGNAGTDYRDRLLSNFRADIHAAHLLLARSGGQRATLVGVRVPKQWAWIPPGYCYNRVGYWHAPGSRLIYRQNGRIRSFGVYSLISWRGQWYVVHLAVWNQPGTVDAPSAGSGPYGPPGGC
jgi:hypothetical protein